MDWCTSRSGPCPWGAPGRGLRSHRDARGLRTLPEQHLPRTPRCLCLIARRVGTDAQRDAPFRWSSDEAPERAQYLLNALLRGDVVRRRGGGRPGPPAARRPTSSTSCSCARCSTRSRTRAMPTPTSYRRCATSGTSSVPAECLEPPDDVRARMMKREQRNRQHSRRQHLRRQRPPRRHRRLARRDDHGLFFQDTRFLSRWACRRRHEPRRPLDRRLRLLRRASSSCSGRRDDSRDSTLSVMRQRAVGDGFHEDLQVLNHGAAAASSRCASTPPPTSPICSR